MNEFFSPVAQRAQLSTHSAEHSNALWLLPRKMPGPTMGPGTCVG